MKTTAPVEDAAQPSGTTSPSPAAHDRATIRRRTDGMRRKRPRGQHQMTPQCGTTPDRTRSEGQAAHAACAVGPLHGEHGWLVDDSTLGEEGLGGRRDVRLQRLEGDIAADKDLCVPARRKASGAGVM